jgi:phage internal scaffolding protein
MSNLFLKRFGNKKINKSQMRSFCTRPGRKDKTGKNIYTTEQHHKDKCDINKIIKKYDKTGVITHVTKFEAKFGDMTGMDFKTMQDKVAKAKSMFEAMPSEIRNRFDNNPADLLSFMENPDNRDKAIELGLIRADWTEETDGLGEHVREGEQVKKTAQTNPEQGEGEANQPAS